MKDICLELIYSYWNNEISYLMLLKELDMLEDKQLRLL